MPPFTAADIVFSEQANHNFSKTLGELKRSTLSISNRLRSIEQDAAFARRVSEGYGRPLIANERCGSWYIDPERKGGSAYFKSTDGHTGVWKFSTRRLNLHLLEIIGRNDGCIIIDSTRRGKRMPDALSKTIPIWCSVINQFLFSSEPQFHELYAPPQVISQSEHAQIAALLPIFLASLQALGIPASDYRGQIKKPLRPFWVTPDTFDSPSSNIFDEFHPVVCCTVSKRVAGGEVSGGGYIQGAGDDTENWAHGLTPSVFWANQQLLMSTSESELPTLIEELVAQASHTADLPENLRYVRPTNCLAISTNSTISLQNAGSGMIILLPTATDESTWRISPKRLEVGLGSHKIGSRNLRPALPFIISFIDEFLKKSDDAVAEQSIIIACETGKDLSIGVALAILCLCFDDEGMVLKDGAKTQLIDKVFIRRRLGWISTSLPDSNPSRATLQSVNSFLMERPK